MISKVSSPIVNALNSYQSSGRVRQPEFTSLGEDTLEISGDSQIFAQALKKAKASALEPSPQSYMRDIGARVSSGTYSVETSMLVNAILLRQ